MAFSEYARQKALTALLRDVMTVALLSGGQELSDQNYRRQLTGFGVDAEGDWRNLDGLQFPPLSVDTVVDGWRLLDATGAEIASEPTKPKVYEAGDQPFLNPGDLVVGLEA